jgi:hypothetical protein
MVSAELLRPKDLNRGEWRQLQTLTRESFASQLPNRTQQEIDTLVAWIDPERFYSSHTDPNYEVGKRFNANQAFSNLSLAVATENQDFVGFAYAANNVSGSTRAERFLKMMGAQKKYFWFREMVVRSDHQREGLASHLGRMLITRSQPWQPTTAYIWPDELRYLPEALRRLTFKPTGEQQVHAFGEEHEPVRQVRMLAPTTMGVMKALNR